MGDSGRPWELYGLPRTTYLYRLRHGVPLGAPYHYGSGGGRQNRRASGLVYDNPPERIEQIKRKYAQGIPAGEIEAWITGREDIPEAEDLEEQLKAL